LGLNDQSGSDIAGIDKAVTLAMPERLIALTDASHEQSLVRDVDERARVKCV
jgi:hypothetical protein